MKIKLKLFDEACMPTKNGEGDWYDLVCAEDTIIHEFENKPTMIPLGVAMELPEGYYAMVLPRSSTPKTYGIFMANGAGIIDHSYCGPNDQWHFPAWAVRESFIPKGERIAQFQVFKKNELVFVESSLHENDDRGGFGSTGR